MKKLKNILMENHKDTSLVDQYDALLTSFDDLIDELKRAEINNSGPVWLNNKAENLSRDLKQIKHSISNLRLDILSLSNNIYGTEFKIH